MFKKHMPVNKFAISNIALPAYDHHALLPALAEIGYRGVEVAPSRVWKDTWTGLRANDVATYRRHVEGAGLAVVGLHSLVFDQPGLGIFADAQTSKRTLDFMLHLSAICRDLGGRTLIWGGGRRRGAMPYDEAFVRAASFMNELAHLVSDHGTCFCFEPLGPTDTDFLNSVAECQALLDAVGHPALQIQLDAKALVENKDGARSTFDAAATSLVHYHANEPGLRILGSSGSIPHAEFGRHLKEVAYDGYISAEQRMLDEYDPIDAAAESFSCLQECYG